MPIVPVYPIDIVRDLNYYYIVIRANPDGVTYTPPAGGFINNNETEYNQIVFDPATTPILVWQDILNINDEAYQYQVMNDVTANWYTVKSKSNSAAQPTGTSSQYIKGDGTFGTYSASGTRTQSALTLSLVGTGATGTQIDAAHDALIFGTVSTSATASISGAGLSTVVLKICATNNATEANWTTIGTSETSQSYALAVAISGVTGMKEQLSTLVPAGWYVKLVNTGSGTHSEAFLSGQKVIFG